MADPFHYGSSLMLTPYAGIYDARTETINLWNTAPKHEMTVTEPGDYVERHNREAFILCEAEDGRYTYL